MYFGDHTIYPYLFQTSGFPVIDDIRAELESQQDWDFAGSDEDAPNIQNNAAKRFNCFAPFSNDQKALRDYLIKHKAGLNISTYAWGLYASAVAPQRQYA